VADEIDAAQQREELDRELALRAALYRAAPKGPAKDTCRCGERISTLRQKLGARLCLDCQAANETRERVARGG
jgi:RNA polymerase-binding transcription factor DksA